MHDVEQELYTTHNIKIKNLKSLTLYGSLSTNASLFVRVTTRRAGNATD